MTAKKNEENNSESGEKEVEEGENYAMDILLGYLERRGVQMHFTAKAGYLCDVLESEGKGL